LPAEGLCYLTAVEAINRFKARSLSPVELMQAIVKRCETVNPKLNAFTYTFYDRALERAHQAELSYSLSGRNTRPLEGIPLVVKDSTAVKRGDIDLWLKDIRRLSPRSYPSCLGTPVGSRSDHYRSHDHARIWRSRQLLYPTLGCDS